MNWARIYLFDAAAMFAIGIFVLSEWRHDGSLYHLITGAVLVLMSPTWLINWSRERRFNPAPERPE